VLRFVPETRGISLEEAGTLFVKKPKDAQVAGSAVA
jgi:hypothetical protein